MVCYMYAGWLFASLVIFFGSVTKDPLNKTMGAGQVIRIVRELKAPRAIKTFCYLIKSTRSPLYVFDEFPYWM